jgi:acyl-ACP thioesterase
MNTTEKEINQFRETFRIGSLDTDYTGRVKIASICNYLQEIAGMHADALHWGIEDLMQQNLSWVLSRLKLQIVEYPHWKEQITITTWPTGSDGLFATRDFKITNAEGKTIMTASSSWLIVNMTRKRPVRPNTIINTELYNDSERVFDQNSQKITIDNKFHYNEKFKVHFSDIDINRHVNNVKYIKWMIDSCPKEHLINKEIQQFEINFLHEAKLDDELEVSRNHKSTHEDQILISTPTSNIENCKAIIHWKQ